MNNFRENDPIRRSSPKVVKHYREYKQELKADFDSKCGYCNDSDHWSGGWRFYQLDHFVPKKYLKNISENEYSNLVYSCFFCNNSKRAKWPTADETISNDGTNGFVHPKEPEYKDHLRRDADGNIIHTTDVGKYMIRAMKLGLKRHGIIWNLEKLEKNFDEIQIEYEKHSLVIPKDLSEQINKMFFEHRKYSKLLRKETDAE